MSKKQNSTALTVNPTIDAVVGIRNEDLVAVAVARRERALGAALLKANKEARFLTDEYDRLLKSHASKLEEAATAEFGSKIEALEAASEALGFQMKLKLQLTGGRYSGGKVSEWTDPEGRLVMGNPSFRGMDAISKFKIGMTPALQETADLLLTNQTAATAIMDTIYALKEEIRNIASTERQARAALAETTLRGSEAGRELLDAMTGMSGLMAVPAIGMILDGEEE
jgi:hypothetical protein